MYFKPTNSLSIFASRKNPNVLPLVAISLILHVLRALVNFYHTHNGIHLNLDLLISIGRTIGTFLLVWCMFSFLLYVFFHGAFPDGFYAQSSFWLWFKFTAYLMVLSSIPLLFGIVFINFAPLMTYRVEFGEAGSFLETTSAPLWFILAFAFVLQVENALAAIVAYRVVRHGFKFPVANSIFMVVVIFVPILIINSLGTVFFSIPIIFGS